MISNAATTWNWAIQRIIAPPLLRGFNKRRSATRVCESVIILLVSAK
jgi:hypothetical protein